MTTPRPAVTGYAGVLFNPKTATQHEVGLVAVALEASWRDYPLGTAVYRHYSTTSKKTTGRIIARHVYLRRDDARFPAFVWVEYDIQALDGQVRPMGSRPPRLQALIDDHRKKLAGHEKRMADINALPAIPVTPTATTT